MNRSSGARLSRDPRSSTTASEREALQGGSILAQDDEARRTDQDREPDPGEQERIANPAAIVRKVIAGEAEEPVVHREGVDGDRHVAAAGRLPERKRPVAPKRREGTNTDSKQIRQTHEQQRQRQREQRQ